ncbi:MAG: DUF3667 domain-containing protein [Saprospiraceae bacterium]|nr:DUF3667 domain-containing protein [Saprospiraceae bacterium]
MEKNKCLNCGEKLINGKDFCPKCGQKSKDTVLTLKQLLHDFTHDILNLDTNLVRTIKAIPVPSLLTKNYVAGHRKSYFTPIRLFLVTMFLHFTLLLFVINLGNNINTNSTLSYVEKARLLEQYDKLSTQYLTEEHCNEIDSIRSHLFAQKLYLDQDTFPGNTYGGLGRLIDDDGLRSYGITMKDAYEMEPSTLFQKYKVNQKLDQMKIVQFIKYDTNRLAGIKFIIGNMAWSIILTVFLSAALMKLLYIRHDIYFVEHACLLMNIHSFAFILLIPLFLAELISPFIADNGYILGVVCFIVIFYGLLSFKSYYRQGWVKTLVKYIFYGFGYFLFIALFGILIFLISVFLF